MGAEVCQDSKLVEPTKEPQPAPRLLLFVDPHLLKLSTLGINTCPTAVARSGVFACDMTV
ncbi:MAG: hypothetical protein CYG59_07770 [Chloroflexi bacterium]|nr:MAG: hypothetical protein CYG59_07770 [Chloroflexota bacterium]